MYSNSRTENDKSISLGLAQKILTIFEKYFKNEPISKKATSGGTLTNFKRNLTLAGDKNDENTVLSSRCFLLSFFFFLLYFSFSFSLTLIIDLLPLFPSRAHLSEERSWIGKRTGQY